MVCEISKPFYYPWVKPGIKIVSSIGDGYTMVLLWNQGYADPVGYNIAYNIYYSTVPFQIETEFIPTLTEGPKYVSTNNTTLQATIVDFNPGDMYYFVVRATQYDPEWYDITELSQDPSQIDKETLQQADVNLYLYPETLLAEDIDEEQTAIPITDIELFPSRGVIKVGMELIRYTGVSTTLGWLTGVTRGFLNSEARLHTTDGYDGYEDQDPVVRFWKGLEHPDLFVIQEQSTFSHPQEIYTIADGYRNQDREGVLLGDHTENDIERADFPAYDWVGWRRTQPSRIFTGTCVDSYIGGESFCADGYNGLNQQIRGIPLFEQVDRLQEALIETVGTGESCVLLRRLWKGITCHCYEPNQENPDPRCPQCYGSGFVGGYEQFYNPRRKDSRIMVRFGPATENIKIEDAGLENTIVYPCWTLSYPALEDRDILIRFKPDGVTEEFRYEIKDVERNKLLYSETGKQNFKVQRIRKTDIVYQWKAIRDTSDEPTTIQTTVGMLRGPNNVPIPHTHTLTISNNTTTLSQINQMTDVAEGHSHPCENGEIISVLGHQHSVILP